MVNLVIREISDKYTTEDLIKILEILRSPDGCPWDREQTHKSIRNDALEEVYEVVDAIDNMDDAALCEELGDMLLQVVFHSRIAEEEGSFRYGDVVDGICRKLILRHPHVFGNSNAESSAEVLDMWDKIKKEEKHQNTYAETLKSVPKAFPSLMRAAKVQKRALKAGAVYEDGKLQERLDALNRAVGLEDKEEIRKAYGKLLFEVTALGQGLKLNAEQALAEETEAFINRFQEEEKTEGEKINFVF